MKKFISFLGTGDYKKCKYTLGKQISGDVIYIQDALTDFLCGDFSDTDKILIYLTDTAKNVHWQKLKRILEQKHFKCQICDVSIPDSKTETDIWELFQKIFNTIDEDDEIYFDLTHSFRFLPMLFLSILHYATYLKHVSVQGIYYGAYETKDNATDITSIFELTDIYTLMQWANAADAFVSYGSTDKISKLVAGTAKDFIGTKTLAGKLNLVEEVMNTVRGNEITKGKVFADCIKKIKDLEIAKISQPAFTPLFETITKTMSQFEMNDVSNFIVAVKLYVAHGMYQQALTIMQEGIITYVLDKIGCDYRSLENREACASVISFTYNEVLGEGKKEQWDNAKQDKVLWSKELFEQLKTKKEFLKLYDKITQARNDINHGGYKKEDGAASTLCKTIKRLADELQMNLPEISSVIITDVQTSDITPRVFCLLNHQLTQKQLAEVSQEYDMRPDSIKYPDNDLSASWAQISDEKKKADSVIQKAVLWLQKSNAQKDDILIIQGESGATFTLVDYALKCGLVPVHAVTKRTAKEKRNGEIIHREYIFEHVCFQKYQYYS